MLTPKQNLMQIITTGVPEYMMGAWDASAEYDGSPYFIDPYNRMELPVTGPGMEAVDMCGW